MSADVPKRSSSKKHQANPSIGEYLIRRLRDYRIGHVFGIPGDYVLGFYDMLQKSPIRVIGTTTEASAGFAADAYARVRGIGALCVTYCVGGLNVANAIAGAYAEKSPVVMLTGSPGLRERHRDPLLHHKVRTFTTQKEIFEKITCAATVLDDPVTAYSEIDRVLQACWTQKRPVYVELPRDMVDVRPSVAPRRRKPIADVSDSDALSEAIAEATDLLNRAKKPVILADVEIHRFNLQPQLLNLLQVSGYPIAATILGKSVISELHPSYLGVYEGAMGRPEVTRAVEGSDCLLMLGTFLTDINLGIFTAQLDRARVIEATSERVQIRHHAFADVRLQDFLVALAAAPLKRRKTAPKKPHTRALKIKPAAKMTIARLFERLNSLLTEEMVVISDVGDSLFGSVDLVIHRNTEFLSPAYYTSMGFAVPAALGAQFANPRLRPIILVGDGAFQMTGMELSTIARHHLNPIVIVLNNHGYTTERFIREGPYNDIHEWNYQELPQVLGAGSGHIVATEGEFETAWKAALASREFSILNVLLDKLDHSPALERLGERLAANLKSGGRT
ncbi:MAG: alpha-keto acid decarboxylase family protein [Candidatus Sumerlaeaceae bacterium]